MRITPEMRKAGILKIGSLQSRNGSYLCLVNLNLVDRECDDVNPRQPTRRHVGEILDGFDTISAEDPRLIFMNGTLKVINGRHTILALLERQIIESTAHVHFDLELHQAANIFFQLGTKQKRIGAWDAHVCGVAARDEQSLSIQAFLEKYEFTYPTGGNGTNAGVEIRNYSVLKEAYVRGTLDMFGSILYECFVSGELQSQARGCEWQRGLLDYINRYKNPRFSGPDPLKAFKNVTAQDVVSLASDSNRQRNNREHYAQAFYQLGNLKWVGYKVS